MLMSYGHLQENTQYLLTCERKMPRKVLQDVVWKIRTNQELKITHTNVDI